jgi:hypothetical protein
LGYTIQPAIKTAVAEANASGELGRYQVLVVAFNDDLYGPTAAAQAQALALYPDGLAVVGPWSVETVAAAEPILAEAGLPASAATDVTIPRSGEKWGGMGMRPWLTLLRSPGMMCACCWTRWPPIFARTAGRRVAVWGRRGRAASLKLCVKPRASAVATIIGSHDR